MGVADINSCCIHQCNLGYYNQHQKNMGVNTQTILGNVGSEPRILNFADGGSAANFSVAVTDKGYTTKDGRQIPDHTEWFNCVAKGNLANVIAQYVHKGDKIYCEGKTRTREYVGSDNVPHKITEVIIERVELLGRLAVQDAAAPQQQDTATQLYGQPQQTTMQQPAAAPPKDDDLPF